MKRIALILTLFTFVGCAESVLDPSQLGGNGNGSSAPRNDRLYFVSTTLDTLGFTSPSINTVSTGNTPIISRFKSDAFITSSPRAGKIAYVTPLGIVVEDLTDTTKFTYIPSGTQVITSAALSADGSRIAYTVLSGNAIYPLGLVQIFTQKLDGTEALYLIESNGDIITMPSFSPDGKRIAFVKKADIPLIGYDSIFIANTDGSARIAIASLPAGMLYDLELDWTSDGSKILMIGDDRGFPCVSFVEVGSKLVQTVIPSNGNMFTYPTLSPDGSMISVVETDNSGYSTISIYNVSGTLEATIESYSINSLIMPQFSSDSKQLVYCSVQGAFVPTDIVNSLAVSGSAVMHYDIASRNLRTLVDSAAIIPLFER